MVLTCSKEECLNTKELIKIYITYVRPVAEALSVILQPMINVEQSELLERQQTMALGIIFGPGISAREMRKLAGIERLEARRIEACEKFTKKCIQSPRFSHWFKERRAPLYERRSSLGYRKYEEELARTNRRWNTPLFYYRRLANKLML